MSKTKQPSWEFIGNLGDQNPLSYGGYFIYRDRTGVYDEKAELLVVDEEGDVDVNNKYSIYRFDLERLKMVGGSLVPLAYEQSWGQPKTMQKGAFEWMPDSDTSRKYEEWFHEDLDKAAAFLGTTKEDLEKAFTSEDFVSRASAYQAVGEYHGFENLDSYPLTDLSYGEVKKRYRNELKNKR